MPINPLLALAVEPPDIAGSFLKGQENAQNTEMNRQKIAAAKYENMTAREKARLSSSLFGAAKLDTYLQSDDLEGAKNFLMERKRNLGARIAEGEDIDTRETDDALRMLDAGETDKLKNITSKALQLGRMMGIFKSDVNTGGATGELVDRYMEATGASFDQALYAVQTGMRQGLGLQNGQVVPLSGAPAAKRQFKYQETAGGQEAERDFARSKAAETKIGTEEPTLAKGQKQVSSVLQNLKDSYSRLDEMGATVSTKRGPAENVAAYVAGSEVGQQAERAVGTKAQSVRNEIKNQLPLLINSIRSATGMSAKAMDSNAELQFYMKMATDPQADIQANLRAIDNIEKMFGSGAGASVPVPSSRNHVPASFNGALPPPPEGFEVLE